MVATHLAIGERLDVTESATALVLSIASLHVDQNTRLTIRLSDSGTSPLRCIPQREKNWRTRTRLEAHARPGDDIHAATSMSSQHAATTSLQQVLSKAWTR